MGILYLLIICAGLTVAEKGKNTGGPTGGTKSPPGPSPGTNTASAYYDSLNRRYTYLNLVVFAGFVLFLFLWQSSTRVSNHLRRLISLNNETQRYFVRGDSRFAWLKQHVIYAPLFRTRHNREFQLSRAINLGTLPSRLDIIFLLGLVTLNIYFCVANVPFHQGASVFAPILRNRTGAIIITNLIPLVILVGRNNPLIPVLGIPFDTWNFFHRWLARIMVLESIAHMTSWLVAKVEFQGGWAVVLNEFRNDRTIVTGLVSICCFAALASHSLSAIRHAFYETFLHFHFIFVVVALAFLWIHLDGLYWQRYLFVALALWVIERVVRIIIIVSRNLGKNQTIANVQALPGDAMRITLKVARPWTFRPGQHLYLYIPSVGLWTSHPFSVAWSQSEEFPTDEKGIVMTTQDIAALQKSTISILVRRRTGFTDQLYKRAENSAGFQVSLRALVEGPYGGIHNLDSYGTVLLIAGGVGITHQVPFVRHLIAGFEDGVVAARRVTLVWVIQSPEHLEWIRPWMTTILAMERRREILRVMLFITRPRNTKEIHSPSATVQMFPGRPNIDTLINMEIENQVGTLGVMVCGTGSLSDDVRRACRKRQAFSNIDFIEESFSW